MNTPSHTNTGNMANQPPPQQQQQQPQQTVFAHPNGTSFVINGQDPYTTVSMPVTGKVYFL